MDLDSDSIIIDSSELEAKGFNDATRPKLRIYSEFHFGDLNASQAQERLAMMPVVTERVQSLYDDGAPFFTKAAIQQIIAQFDSPSDEDLSESGFPKILLPAVDGSQVETELLTGKIMGPYYEGSLERVAMDPYLSYMTYQRLSIHKADPDLFSTKLAYCPLRINYHIKLRDKSTRELVPSWEHQPSASVRTSFAAELENWRASSACKQLRAILLGTTMSADISKIIAFACSTIAAKTEKTSTSMLQHALVLTLRDTIAEANATKGDKIGCWAQDPIYTVVDTEVLGEHGIKVVRDPGGFLEVDDQSVIVSICPNEPIRQVVTDLARPAVLVWDRVMSEEEAKYYWNRANSGIDPNLVTDAESSRVRDMIGKEYDEILRLGELDDNFGTACVYVRRRQA